ncbi:MAG: IclR family transcriptional regulator [Bryobacterales bacterium]|nr:IclR family transcriptional regulator [Bryobacterales bacterium]
MSSSLRCLEVLRVLARSPYAYSLTEIANALSIVKSSAHRFLTTLIAGGFVEQDMPTRRYQLAGTALWVGTAYLRHSKIYRCGYELVHNLARDAKTMAHLAVWDNDMVLYLHSIGPPRSLNLFADAGERRAVHATALGKAMLAHRPAEDLRRIFNTERERYTENTLTSLAAMSEELHRIREVGYAVDNEEGTRGVRCVAAGIKDQGERVIGAISTSGPRSLINGTGVLQFARLVQEAALRISVQLGYRPSTSNLSSLLEPIVRRDDGTAPD